jgi:hypothetical protein
MLFIAVPCGCQCEIGMTKAREPQTCEHGNLLRYSKALSASAPSSRSKPAGTRKSRKPLRRSEPKRDWTDARAKVDHEGCCRICKRTDRPLEVAHVLGREHDEPKVSKTTGEILQELYVHPDRIFPACGPFPEGCHGDAEYRRINVLSHLTLEEQLQAVKDAGGIEAARIRLEPVTHREEVEASSAPAIEGAVG